MPAGIPKPPLSNPNGVVKRYVHLLLSPGWQTAARCRGESPKAVRFHGTPRCVAPRQLRDAVAFALIVADEVKAFVHGSGLLASPLPRRM
jgi:hypothetical protein